MQAREKLKANNAKKRGELDESKLFQDFRTEVGEMNNFVAERKLVREDSFRDGIGNIKANAKKHQVFEGEIKANAGQLKVLNRTGQQMVQRNHFKAREIGEELAGVNSAWEGLLKAVKEQGSNRDDVLSRELKNLKNTAKVRRDCLVMAIQLHEYNRESGQFLAWITRRFFLQGSRNLR